MPRLLVHVEGETEETFVREVLAQRLRAAGYSDVQARLAGNPRRQRGGIRPWPGYRWDILRHLKDDRTAVHTMIVDFYGMPQAWPGRTEASRYRSAGDRARTVEAALLEDIAGGMGPRFDNRRFVPFVMMHEFEALLFSAPEHLANALQKPELTRRLQAIRDEFAGPEEIDDSPITAPSKRIEDLFPRYEKVLFGNIAALDIGLETMRQECPHFNDWLTRIETLPGQFA